MYTAHISEKNEVQSVKQHCENTAALAENFSVKEMKQLVRAVGMLHDIGKYQPSFQKRINGANIAVDHSICGAIAAKEMYAPFAAHMMECCIAGHHGGIPDPGDPNSTPDDVPSTLCGRLKKICEDFSVYKDELEKVQIDEKKFLEFLSRDCRNSMDVLVDKYAFLTRYCFSCLTDADSIDTAEFCSGEKRRTLQTDFKECLKLLNEKMSNFSCTTQLQKTRSLIQQQVYDKVDKNADIYLMNMPTGSGKTLCSIKFALEKAIKLEKKRIIYIIPYNSIIDQTAEEFEKIFGKECGLLRHQSTFSYDDSDDYSEDYRLSASASAENWDAQLIITTAVQFFESVYSNRKGKLRKLHNMADSILVFDEAHLMPVNYLQPCLESVAFITRYLNSKAVFLTATMPDFRRLIKEYVLPDTEIIELIDNKTLFDRFDKCSYEYCGVKSDEALLALSQGSPSSLIVVNKRKSAKRLYKICHGKKFHLSTYMTAADRTRVIDEIKKELIELDNDFPNGCEIPDDRRITVISTSLIEAGVDLDFVSVFREMTGLDSILQAGGRCNREGKRQNAKVTIFELECEKGKPSMDERTNITKGIIISDNNITSAESIASYYDRLYFVKKGEITANAICNGCKSFNTLAFKTYADKFELIDSKTVSVVFPCDDEGCKLVERLRLKLPYDSRKLQKYAFTVYRYELDDLINQHAVEDFGSGVWCLVSSDYYDADTGVSFEAKDVFIK